MDEGILKMALEYLFGNDDLELYVGSSSLGIQKINHSFKIFLHFRLKDRMAWLLVILLNSDINEEKIEFNKAFQRKLKSKSEQKNKNCNWNKKTFYCENSILAIIYEVQQLYETNYAYHGTNM